MYSWTCPHCGANFTKAGKPALGMARENHLRKHRVPLPPRPEYIPRDYDQYPEGICGDMAGDCMNCPLPENMRGECCQKDDKGPGYDTGKRP